VENELGTWRVYISPTLSLSLFSCRSPALFCRSWQRELVSINIQHSFLHFKFRWKNARVAPSIRIYVYIVCSAVHISCIAPSCSHAINARALLSISLAPSSPFRFPFSRPGTMPHIKVITHLNLPSVASPAEKGYKQIKWPEKVVYRSSGQRQVYRLSHSGCFSGELPQDYNFKTVRSDWQYLWKCHLKWKNFLYFLCFFLNILRSLQHLCIMI